MKPVLFLRTASVLTLLHAVLHTIGGVFGKPKPGAQQAAVTAMQANTFPVMGLTRSFWDFYIGLGLAVSIVLLVEAIVFWQLGSLSKADGLRLRPILGTFAIGYLALAVNAFRYFFIAPVIVEVLIALLLGLAMATSHAPEASIRRAT